MQDFEDLNICVGSFIICERQNWEVTKSSIEHSKLVLLFEQQSLDLTLKSPVMTITNRLPDNRTSKCTFRFDLYVSNSSCVWLGDSGDEWSTKLCNQCLSQK